MPDDPAQQQSFSLANMVPQTAALNRGVWAGIEAAVRHLAARRGELYLVTGPAFVGQQLQSIGLDGVLVPSSTWKAVYDPRARATGVYICTNTANPQCEIVPVSTLARVVGVDPFPALSASQKETAMRLPEPESYRSSSSYRRRPRPDPSGFIDQLFGHRERPGRRSLLSPVTRHPDQLPG